MQQGGSRAQVAISSSSRDTEEDSISEQLHHTPHAALGHHAQAHQLHAQEQPVTSRRMPHSRSHRETNGRRRQQASSPAVDSKGGRSTKAQEGCAASCLISSTV